MAFCGKNQFILPKKDNRGFLTLTHRFSRDGKVGKLLKVETILIPMSVLQVLISSVDSLASKFKEVQQNAFLMKSSYEDDCEDYYTHNIGHFEMEESSLILLLSVGMYRYYYYYYNINE